jgi:hypothetical protein
MISSTFFAADWIGNVHGQQPRDRYRWPLPLSKYKGMTVMPSLRMYSQTFNSVQWSSGWIRTCAPGGQSILY